MKGGPRLALVGLCAIAATALLLAEYVALRMDRVPDADEAGALPVSSALLPWGSHALRQSGIAASDHWRRRPAETSAEIRRALEAYPLEAAWWETLARIEAHFPGVAEESDLAGDLSAATAAQPYNRRVRWRASQLALQAGDTDLAEIHLRSWLRGQPSGVGRAFFTARRWIRDPEALLDRVLPEGREYLMEALAYAARQEDLALGEAAWARIGSVTKLDDPALEAMSDLYRSLERFESLAELWAGVDPEYSAGAFPDGSFERPLDAPGAFGWRRLNRLPDGVAASRDEETFWLAPASLRLSFDGSENLRLRHPSIQFPVPEPGRYRLQGHWRGDGLTTRSLPELVARVAVPRSSVGRVEAESGTFDWTEWSFEFELEGPALMHLNFARSTTDAFDRYIEGDLWLDAVELIRLDDEQAPVIDPVDLPGDGPDSSPDEGGP